MKYYGMFLLTLKESIRKGSLIFYFGVSIFILFLLIIGLGLSPENQNIVTFFDKPFAVNSEENNAVVNYVLILLLNASVFWIIIMGVIGSSGLIPSMLKVGTIDLYLSKPLSRTQILFTRTLGAISGVIAYLLFFLISVWIIFGIKINVWHSGFLLSILSVIYIFVCFFSIVTFIGLTTKSPILTILIAFAYYIISWGLDAREHGMYLLWNNVVYHRILDGIYYLTPQISDMLSNTALIIGKNPFKYNNNVFDYAPFIWSLFSSSLFYGASAYYFDKNDY